MSWKPNSSIGKSETIGRRVLESQRSKHDRLKIKFDAFIENRPDSNLSVDRLGDGNPVKKVVDYLRPLGERFAEERGKPGTFIGWASWTTSKLTSRPFNLELIATPIAENVEKGIARNDYHADIATAKYGRAEQDRVAPLLADNASLVSAVKKSKSIFMAKWEWLIEKFSFLNKPFN